MYHHDKRQHVVIASIALAVIIFFIALGAWSYVRTPERGALSLLAWLIPDRVAERAPSLMSYLLGFDEERTFLVLLLNNTELRPGGGFIGTYAVATMRNGQLTDLFVEGSDRLDARAPARQVAYPAPKPIQDYLKVDQWQFRDSNWSPDFSEGAKWALWLYRQEGGQSADRIDGVIGVTATVLEELINLTGSITIDDVTIRQGSAVSDLEYEVEYAFSHRGLPVVERKVILGDLAHVIARRLVSVAPARWKEILDTFHRLGREKYVMLYAADPAVQAVISAEGWSGEVKPFFGDGFMVVDANLGALKTDNAMRRYYNYAVRPTKNGAFEGTLTIRYEHRGAFDWRTGRYRSYTRVYLPDDVVVKEVRGFVDPENPTKQVPADHGAREGMQLRGGYIRVAPDESQEVVITYALSPKVQKAIADGVYTFSVQKQLGLVDPQLTLDLDFGTKKHTETRVLKEDYELVLPFE